MKLITDKGSNGLTSKEFIEYLKTPCPKTELTAIEADKLEETLKEGLKQYPGLGISATQLGIKVRACYIEFGEDNLFLLNPIVTFISNDKFLFYEGCLSIPSTLRKPLKTIRSSKIVVMTDNLGELTFEINPDGDKANESVSKETMMTVIVQHEIDHLDGITIRERVYNPQFIKKSTYGRNDLIVMKSPKGEMIEVKFKKANNYFLQGYEIV